MISIYIKKIKNKNKNNNYYYYKVVTPSTPRDLQHQSQQYNEK